MSTRQRSGAVASLVAIGCAIGSACGGVSPVPHPQTSLAGEDASAMEPAIATPHDAGVLEHRESVTRDPSSLPSCTSSPPQPALTMGPVAAVASQDYVASLTRILHYNAGRYRACYESELTRDPSAHGTLDVHFDVDAKLGSVTHAELAGKSTLDSKEARECVLRVIAAEVFPLPPAKRDVRVSFPITFALKDDPRWQPDTKASALGSRSSECSGVVTEAFTESDAAEGARMVGRACECERRGEPEIVPPHSATLRGRIDESGNVKDAFLEADGNFAASASGQCITQRFGNLFFRPLPGCTRMIRISFTFGADAGP